MLKCLNRLGIFYSHLLRVPLKSAPKYFAMIAQARKVIQDFGYAFNNEGKLRKIAEDGELTDQPFQFNISDKHNECQEHYEEIGTAITEYIYSILDNELKFIRLPVPKDATPETGTFIFASPDYDRKENLLLLIHGSGVVRAGQWARSLIINDCLDTGSQIPFIKRALSKDYGVLVLNTNDNYASNGEVITHSEIPEEHGVYVWKNYVSECAASAVLIVAHSYGGVVTVAMADMLKGDFEKRVKGIALTDSVHWYASNDLAQHLKQVARNWVASPAPLDTPVATPEYDVPRVSAGHQQHEMTSYTSMDSIFQFLEDKLHNK